MADDAVTGIVPVIPTPFDRDERIDHDALSRCVDFAVKCGVGAVCLPAYASEFYKLSEDERAEVLDVAIEAAAGRVAIIAQSNHPAARCAAETAAANERRGANIISFALPRQFAVPDSALIDYAREVCDAVNAPVLIQDFNPGGPTVGADFCAELRSHCDNFRYVKLEEPLMSEKVADIRQATEDGVGVLEGWGGMFILELMPSGICGVMPALSVSDHLQRVWDDVNIGRTAEAFRRFSVLLPQIVFSLTSLEVFHWAEKDLLSRRGVLPPTATKPRQPTVRLDEKSQRYMEFVNEQVVGLSEST